MADYYISVNKYDLAEAELKNCLKYNKSMIKAEELMGLIKEKEKAYVDAADHYAVAWKMSNKKNGGVGFRLAFNYLKADRYVDAIDVGKDILKVYPNFPKVQTEIIDKARGLIRCWAIHEKFDIQRFVPSLRQLACHGAFHKTINPL